MMKRIRQWLLNLLFQQNEPTPEPTPKQGEEKIEVVSRQPVNGRTKQLIAKGVEQFFNDHYDLRFNILKRCEEFRPLPLEKAAGFAKKAPGFAQKAPPFGKKVLVKVSVPFFLFTFALSFLKTNKPQD